MRVSLGPFFKPDPNEYYPVCNLPLAARVMLAIGALICIVVGAVAIAKNGVNMGLGRFVTRSQGIAYVSIGSAILLASGLKFYKKDDWKGPDETAQQRDFQLKAASGLTHEAMQREEDHKSAEF